MAADTMMINSSPVVKSFWSFVVLMLSPSQKVRGFLLSRSRLRQSADR